MSISIYLAFVAATVVLVAIPGPNVALIVANSIAYGPSFGLVTVVGTTTAALLLQLAFVTLGLTGSLIMAGWFFEGVRWVGVAYLAYLGLTAWHAAVADLSQLALEPRSKRVIFARGILVSLTNPKSLLFYGAFFPQFIRPGPNLLGQMLLLSVTFVTIAAVHDCCWAFAAGRLRPLLTARGPLRNRLTGGFYLAAAAGLIVMLAGRNDVPL